MAEFSIVGQKLPTRSRICDLYSFLSDFKNFAEILPEDKVENFTYSANHCAFSIKGITAMTIHLKEKSENSYLLFNSQGLARFNFNLKASFEGPSTEIGHALIELSGDLNPFILSMAEKSLKALVDSMSTKLSQLIVL